MTHSQAEPGQGSGHRAATVVVVAGAASRDIAPGDPRGWRLGGSVTYASLAMARLGLRVVALIGVDAEAAQAHELDLLRESGVDLRTVPLAHGPVFENIERPEGRVQRALSAADPLRPAAASGLAEIAARARGWFIAPVAAELDDEWLGVIPRSASVALGWQGLLRTFGADGRVHRRAPTASGLVRRADLVGLSRDDVARDTSLGDLIGCLAPGATLVMTHGFGGGLLVGPVQEGVRPLRCYPALASGGPVDPTGAGDAFLAALFAARLEPSLIGGRTNQGFDLLLAAATASLVVENAGLMGVPTRSAIRDRMREGRAAASRRT